jgi:hypothetical protein
MKVKGSMVDKDASVTGRILKIINSTFRLLAGMINVM